MKFVVILCLIATATVAATAPVEVLKQEARVEHDGTFRFFYELNDGTQVIESGAQKQVDADHAGEAVEGKFAFVADDGKEYVVTYTADENGFRPVGSHLPTPPPVPESVLKTLKYLEEHPYHQPEGRKY